MATALAHQPRAYTWARFVKFTFPFVVVHLLCLLVFVVGWSPFALIVSAFVYLLRGLGITAFYHRKFAHHAFETSRPVQFIGAWLGTSAAQGGPLWWVAHHRKHHRASDQPGDTHSPLQDGFTYAHMGWLMDDSADETDFDEVADLARYPELRFLNTYSWLPIVSTAVGLFFFGFLVGRVLPWELTNGPQLLVWGFFINTVLLWHVTFGINSVCHKFGARHHETTDDSRNNALWGLLALGEGWHNNHHRFPGAARHGFRRSQIDITNRVIRLMAGFGLAWNLRPVPKRLWLGSGEPMGASS